MIQPDIFRLSPNVNPQFMPSTAHTVIIHATRSGTSMNPTEFTGTLNYMSQIGTVSSHWVISRNGVKARVVMDNRQAWHAQEDNDNAWGIELEQGIEMDGFTDAQMTALVAVCRGYRDDFNVPAVHSTNSTIGGFVGHQETAQGIRNGKSDPGRLFPWGYFIGALQMPEPTPTPPPQPTEVQALRALVRAGSIIAAGNQNLADLSPEDQSALRWVVAQFS